MGFLKRMASAVSSKPSGINVAASTLPSHNLLSVVGESFYNRSRSDSQQRNPR